MNNVSLKWNSDADLLCLTRVQERMSVLGTCSVTLIRSSRHANSVT